METASARAGTVSERVCLRLNESSVVVKLFTDLTGIHFPCIKDRKALQDSHCNAEHCHMHFNGTHGVVILGKKIYRNFMNQ